LIFDLLWSEKIENNDSYKTDSIASITPENNLCDEEMKKAI
jgi:hypothetical protein